jgi:lipoprotein signal peptidase
VNIMRIHEYIFVKYIFFFSLLVIIDQVSKYSIRHSSGFYICNADISWNIAIPNYVFWLFWTMAIVLLLFLLFKNPATHKSIFIILILAGAFSNIIDRINYGCVIDFIDLKLWPVFNLADVFIISGAILLLVKWKKL